MTSQLLHEFEVPSQTVGRLVCIETQYGRLFAEDAVDAYARDRAQEQKPRVSNAASRL
jgi:hypothetical protein